MAMSTAFPKSLMFHLYCLTFGVKNIHLGLKYVKYTLGNIFVSIEKKNPSQVYSILVIFFYPENYLSQEENAKSISNVLQTQI